MRTITEDELAIITTALTINEFLKLKKKSLEGLQKIINFVKDNVNHNTDYYTKD